MMSLPVMFPEIGPKYAGTAGGLAVTLELLGAVIIPTYIIVPLGGGNVFQLLLSRMRMHGDRQPHLLCYG